MVSSPGKTLGNIEEAKARLLQGLTLVGKGGEQALVCAMDVAVVLDRLDAVEAEKEVHEDWADAVCVGLGYPMDDLPSAEELVSKVKAVEELALELVDGLKVEIAVDENNYGKASESDYRLLERARALLGGETHG